MCNRNFRHHDRCLLPYICSHCPTQAQGQIEEAPATAAAALNNHPPSMLSIKEPAPRPLPGPAVPRLESRVPIVQRRQLSPLPRLGHLPGWDERWNGFATPVFAVRRGELPEIEHISPRTRIPLSLSLRPAHVHRRPSHEYDAPNLTYGPPEACSAIIHRSVHHTSPQPIPSSAALVFASTPRANAWPPAMLTPFPLRLDPPAQDPALTCQNSLVYRGYSWSPHRGWSLCSDGAVVGPSGLPTPPYVPPWYEGGWSAPGPDSLTSLASAVDLPGLRNLNYTVFNAREKPDGKPDEANGGTVEGAAGGPSQVRRPARAPLDLHSRAGRSSSPDWPAVPANTPEDRVERHFWTAASRGDDVCYDVALRKGQPPPTPAQETSEEEARERGRGATSRTKVKENWDGPSSGENSPAGK
ncbi:hypothetical protein LTR37_021256 [Vermiconidia calcicola]|uniref:Uncharacterized protein n=1 Tax=Vermiconidia calcicola TaxID=1690605 RepID=A0ACC3MAC3_9PEZI|nr:hypothetical protein LTR37_021256 [Vermiconidia calcicola]